MVPRLKLPLLIAAVLSAFALCVPAVVRAQEAAARAEFHGFGGFSYGQTSEHRYLSGTPDGNFRNGSLALNVTAHPAPKLSVAAQLFSIDVEQGHRTQIDYAFAEWRTSDAVRFRAGKVKQPFGIYTEVYDVGTVRPFLSLPQGVYGPVGITSEGFDGVALRGDHALSGRWRAAYDLYAGGMTLEDSRAPLQALAGDSIEIDEGEEVETVKSLVGLRLVFATPLRGLHLGGSAYSGEETEAVESGRHTVVGAQAEYLNDVIWLRSEWVGKAEGPTRSRSVYAELAVFLTSHWQVGGRLDRLTARIDGGAAPSVPRALAEHRDLAFGLNYWLAPEFVLKVSWHDVRGTRIAGPEAGELAAQLLAGSLRDRTTLLQIGTQFSF